MQAPSFWYKKWCTPAARWLKPIATLWYYLTRSKRNPRPIKPFVICVGNVTAGGTGKTPVVQRLARHFKSKDLKVAILLRGYGGRLGKWKAWVVDPKKHTAKDVGDEALLHSEITTTIVAKNRFKGGKLAQSLGIDVVIMDDGLQNETLKKDYSFCVVSQMRGFGNRALIPAGPLREPLACAFKKVSSFLVIGPKGVSLEDLDPLEELQSFEVLQAFMVPHPEDWSRLRGRTLYAFAGIGEPEKFFAMLQLEGLKVLGTQGFPDHYVYTSEDLRDLDAQARKGDAHLVTTLKDYVKLPDDFKKKVIPVRMNLEFKFNDRFKLLLKKLEGSVQEKLKKAQKSQGK